MDNLIGVVIMEVNENIFNVNFFKVFFFRYLKVRYINKEIYFVKLKLFLYLNLKNYN